MKHHGDNSLMTVLQLKFFILHVLNTWVSYYMNDYSRLIIYCIGIKKRYYALNLFVCFVWVSNR